MLWMLDALLGAIGAVMKIAFIPACIAMLVSIPAGPLMDLFKIPEDAQAPARAIMRWVGYVSTALVLLGFVLLFGSLWLASRQAQG